MTVICLFASLFFLFLQPVNKELNDDADQIDEDSGELLKAVKPQNLEESPELNTAKQDVKDTFRMLMNGRMATTYLMMLSTALNIAILSGVFIKMMVDTMQDNKTEWGDQ